LNISSQVFWSKSAQFYQSSKLAHIDDTVLQNIKVSLNLV